MVATRVLLSSSVDYQINISNVDEICYSSSSFDNDFVPYHAVFTGSYKKIKNLNYCEYYVPSEQANIRTTNKLIHFQLAMEKCGRPVAYTKGAFTYYVAKGLIYLLEDGHPKILFALSVRKSYLFGGDMKLDSLDYSKFVMVVDNELLKAERRPLFNILKKEVIEPLTQQGIDIMYSGNATQLCYKSPVEPYTFKNLSERRVFLNGITNTVLDGLTGRTETRRTAT